MNINEIVIQLVVKHPGGGRPFFNDLDESVRNRHFFITLLNMITNSSIQQNIIVSGKFGDYFASWISLVDSTHVVVKVNGGLRDGEPIIDLYPFKDILLGRVFVFIDDSYFSGKTFDVIQKELDKFNATIDEACVVYDGSKIKQPGVRSMYRYYDNYNDSITYIGPMEWTDCPRADGRMEWLCKHGVGHGNHIHGCDGCCGRDDFPGRPKDGRKGS